MNFCSSCGAAVTPEARFCSNCGTRLQDAAPPTSIRRKRTEGSIRAERRQLTVMFCDIAGSTKLSEQLDPEDLILAHVGGMDVCARGLKAAAALLKDGRLEEMRSARYADWEKDQGKKIKSADLSELSDLVISGDIRPEPRSGRQERLENLVNSVIDRA